MVQSDASFTSVHEGNDLPPLCVSAPRLPEVNIRKPRRKLWIWLLLVVFLWIAVISLIWITVLLSLVSRQSARIWGSQQEVASTVSGIVKTMPKSLENPNAQTRACIMAWAIAENISGEEKLISSEQVYVLKALEHHPFRAQLQHQCLRAIESSFAPQDIRAPESNRILAVVVKAMQNHGSNMEVQAYGTRILDAMSRTLLMDTSGIANVVTEALKKFSWHKEIVKQSLGILAKLSEDTTINTDPSSPISVRARHLLSTHVDRAQARFPSTCSDLCWIQHNLPSKAVVELSLEILANEESRTPSMGEERSHTHTAVWKAVRTFDDPTITGLSLKLLLALVQTGKGDTSFHGLTSSETDVLLERMERYGANKEVQQHGAKILEIFPSAIPKRKVVGVLKEAMRQHENSLPIAESSLAILGNLDTLDLFQLYTPDGADLLLDVFWRFQSVDLIQIQFFKLFGRFVEVSPPSFPTLAKKKAEVVLRALDLIERTPAPQHEGPLRQGRIQFHLTAMLYFLSNEEIQERCLSALSQFGPIDDSKGFDIVRGAYRTYGSHNSAIRRNALAILERMGERPSR